MWAGGKRKMLVHYGPLLPAGGDMYGYVEPFAGGAALLATLRTRDGALPAVLGDGNAELMGLYEQVRDRPEALLAALQPYEEAWSGQGIEPRKALYYRLRQAYWDMRGAGPRARLRETALLFFLMKTGFNGIWQTCADSHGKYGTPVGLANQKGAVVDPATVMVWHELLRGVALHTGDWRGIQVADGSFVFCDPPYRDSFTHYSTGFQDSDQEALVEWCRDTARRRRALVWLANRLSEPDDGFFNRVASDAVLHTFPVTYTAGRRKATEDGYAAKKAKEVLLIWDGRRAKAAAA